MSVNSYSNIIGRIEQNLSAAPSAHNLGSNASNHIAEASGESDEKDQERKASQLRAHHEQALMEESKEAARDVAVAADESLARDDDAEQPFRRTNTSAYYRSMERKRKRYTPSAEELADD